jgi:hypothetical protein
MLGNLRLDAMKVLAMTSKTGPRHHLATQENRLPDIITLKDLMKFFAS